MTDTDLDLCYINILKIMNLFDISNLRLILKEYDPLHF